jgi:hypothetical protein
VFDGQLTTAGADATDASSSAAAHTEILAIADDSSGGGGLTARSQGSDRGSEWSSQTGGQSSVNMMMNNSIFVAKVSVTHHTITVFHIYSFKGAGLCVGRRRFRRQELDRRAQAQAERSNCSRNCAKFKKSERDEFGEREKFVS